MCRYVLGICLWLAGLAVAWGQTPDWVSSHPASSDAYVGIGMAPLSDADYMKKATQNALSDIVSQIAQKVELTSFLHTVDVDGKSRDMFEEKVRNSMTAWIEGHELKDSYRSDRNYYVYYVLDKKVYEKKAAQRRYEVVTKALSYLRQGRDAEAAMNLMQAVQLYGKGLAEVEPWVFMDLSTTESGSRIDIPAELYNAYVNVFAGMAITTNVVQIEGEAFKPVADPIAGCLSKNGTVVPNVKLKALFVSGSGTVSPSVQTDYTGTAEFYVTNITSKQNVQELRITVDDSFMSALPEAYRQLLDKQSWPAAKITLTLKNSPVTAYLYASNDELPGCQRQIASLLANNYFVISEDPDAAQCFVDLSTTLELGGVVKGQLFDANECYCTLVLKIYNNKTQEQLMNYTADRVKVLVPTNKSVEQTSAMCVREVMKRVNRELPKQIKSLNLN